MSKMFKKRGTYTGPVAFVNGFHYPVEKDGHPRTSQPLVVEMRGGKEVFVWGTKKSPTHTHTYEKRQVEVVPFSEDADG